MRARRDYSVESENSLRLPNPTLSEREGWGWPQAAGQQLLRLLGLLRLPIGIRTLRFPLGQRGHVRFERLRDCLVLGGLHHGQTEAGTGLRQVLLELRLQGFLLFLG